MYGIMTKTDTIEFLYLALVLKLYVIELKFQ